MTYCDDWVQVRALADRYALGVNERDAAAIVGLFVPDGQWQVDAPFNVNIVGAQAIGAAIAQSLAGMELIFQMVHSVVPEFHGEEGRARCSVHEMARMTDGKGGLFMLGTYEDVVVRVNGRWLFKHRRFRPAYLDQTAPVGMVFPAGSQK